MLCYAVSLFYMSLACLPAWPTVSLYLNYIPFHRYHIFLFLDYLHSFSSLSLTLFYLSQCTAPTSPLLHYFLFHRNLSDWCISFKAARIELSKLDQCFRWSILKNWIELNFRFNSFQSCTVRPLLVHSLLLLLLLLLCTCARTISHTRTNMNKYIRILTDRHMHTHKYTWQTHTYTLTRQTCCGWVSFPTATRSISWWHHADSKVS